ncbi:MAG TPA: CHAT domain-containing protein [Caulobacteraceae bacterium]|jgi:CHAT domain-containing protein|nr:CHAT domain-containing protein [Caulobacteraceae bacterium]
MRAPSLRSADLRRRLAAAVATTVLFAAGAACAQSTEAPSLRFALAHDVAGQACSAVRIYGDPLIHGERERAYDLYCGAEDDPVGRVYLLDGPGRLDAWRASLSVCTDARPLDWPQADVNEPHASLCRGGTRPAEARLSASSGGLIVAGTAAPPAAPAIQSAMRILLGVAKPGPDVAAATATSPLLTSLTSALGGPVSGVSPQDFQTLVAAGNDSNTLALYAQAESFFSEAVAAHRTFWPDDKMGEGDLRLELALNLSDQGRFGEARKIFRDLQPVLDRDPAAGAKLRLYEAEDALNDEGDRDRVKRAADLVAQAQALLDTAQKQGDRPLLEAERLNVLRALLWRAAARVSEGDPARVQADLDTAMTALDQVEQSNADWLRALTARDIAVLQVSQHHPEQAIATLNAAIERLDKTSPGTRVESALKIELARVHAAGGQNAEALSEYRAAFDLLGHAGEASGATADEAVGYFEALETGKGGDTIGFDDPRAAEYFALFESVSRTSVQQTAAAAAARLGDPQDRMLVRKWQDAQRAALSARIEVNRVSADAKASAADRAGAAEALKAANAAADVLAREVYDRDPNYATLAKGPVALDEVRAALTDEDVVARLLVGGNGGAGLLITKAGVTPFRIDAGAAEITDLVRKVKESARQPGTFDLAASSQLYQAVFANAGPALLADTSKARLIVDVQGPLAAVPLAVLVTQPSGDAANFATASWLGKRYQIIDSAGLRGLKSTGKPGTAFVGYGDFTPLREGAGKLQQVDWIVKARGLPSDTCRIALLTMIADLPPLENTRYELDAAHGNLGGEVHMGADFRPETMIKDDSLSNAGVVLLATHGVFRGVERDAAESTCLPEAALVTSAPSAPGDMFLDTAAVLNLRLDANLVVLSACDTGQPVAVDPGQTGLPSGGDALSGFARAFLYAGARNVVVTHWPLSDAYAATFMTLFTGALKNGDSPSAALQKAQVASIASDANADPFYWGPFTLVSMGLPGAP